MPVYRMKAQRLIEIGILALAGVQAAILASAVVIPLAEKTIPVLSRSAVDRSAAILFGTEFAEYTSFLRAHIPEGATVVLPPEETDEVLGHVGLMSYFLFPRRVVDCPSREPLEPCISALRGKSTYILRVSGFPPTAAAEASKTLIPFNATQGVYVPREVP